PQSRDIPLQTDLKHVIDSLIGKGHEDELFPGIALALIQHDTVQFSNSGYANIAKQIKSTEDTRYQLGSLGKLVTAIAVLQLVDSGRLDVHANIATYLELPFDKEYAPITLHCLLTHSCGFNDLNIGYFARNAAHVLPLEQFVLERYPGRFQDTKKDIVYSNYGYAVAGRIVEKMSGIDFKEYCSRYIFDVLGMDATTFEFPYGYQEINRYASAYKKADQGFEEVAIYPRHAVPAGSLVSNSKDMAVFANALLKRDERLLSQRSWTSFFSEQFSNHPKLNGYSYGMEQQNFRGHEFWAKGGMIPGMLSQIVIVPDSFALFLTVNTDDDRFGEQFHKVLFDRLFHNEIEPQPYFEMPTSKYVGVYREKRYNRDSEENMISLFRGQFDVYASPSGDTLQLYHNGQWNAYIPVSNDLFQHTTLPHEHLYFKKDQGSMNLYRNLNIGGLSMPMSYEKTQWYNSPVFINEYYGIILLIILSAIPFVAVNGLVRLIRRFKSKSSGKNRIPIRIDVILLLCTLVFLVHTYLVPLQLLKNTQEFLFGFTASFETGKLLIYLMGALTLTLGYLTWQTWRKKQGSAFLRCYLSVVLFSITVHILYLGYWNFI
ncbi:MAG: serine hydrolase domain-containing protein, partial [Bacteroidota bacterium]